MKPGLELSKVVLLGRTFEEYCRFFALNEGELRGEKILDVASGVSSFCAEANARGLSATAFDPIYELSPEGIKSRCEHDLEFVTSEIGKVKAYKWDFYKSPEGMREYRDRAYKKFLEDYEMQRGRYVAGRLPNTPFRDEQFDLTLVSYFLFVYEEQFDYEFHKQSITEILRITSGETRIYPLVNFKAERSQFIERIKSEPRFANWNFEELKTDFEFLRNSNSFLRISKRINREIR